MILIVTCFFFIIIIIYLLSQVHSLQRMVALFPLDTDVSNVQYLTTWLAVAQNNAALLNDYTVLSSPSSSPATALAAAASELPSMWVDLVQVLDADVPQCAGRVYMTLDMSVVDFMEQIAIHTQRSSSEFVLVWDEHVLSREAPFLPLDPSRGFQAILWIFPVSSSLLSIDYRLAIKHLSSPSSILLNTPTLFHALWRLLAPPSSESKREAASKACTGSWNSDLLSVAVETARLFACLPLPFQSLRGLLHGNNAVVDVSSEFRFAYSLRVVDSLLHLGYPALTEVLCVFFLVSSPVNFLLSLIDFYQYLMIYFRKTCQYQRGWEIWN
jgi:hypothetical protein